MKNVVFAGLMILAAQVSFAQNGVKNDPTYSANNYKHPNKAKYAKEHNLGNPVSIETREVAVKENYKQSFSAGKSSQKVSVEARAYSRGSKSYKHPYGL
jgi:hypothetical protein